MKYLKTYNESTRWSLKEYDIREMLYDISDNDISIWIEPEDETHDQYYGKEEKVIPDGMNFTITFNRATSASLRRNEGFQKISWDEVKEGIGHLTSYLSDRYTPSAVVSLSDPFGGELIAFAHVCLNECKDGKFVAKIDGKDITLPSDERIFVAVAISFDSIK